MVLTEMRYSKMYRGQLVQGTLKQILHVYHSVSIMDLKEIEKLSQVFLSMILSMNNQIHFNHHGLQLQEFLVADIIIFMVKNGYTKEMLIVLKVRMEMMKILRSSSKERDNLNMLHAWV